MRTMRAEPGPALTDQELIRTYAYPEDALPWVRANMVSTVDGAAAGGDAVTASVSTEADRRLFHLLRGLADVILVGAGTARAERYGPADPEPATGNHRRGLGQSPAATIAVVSASLQLDVDGPLLGARSDRVLVVTSQSAPPERRRAVESRVEVVLAGEDRVDPVAAVAALADRGLPRVLCEGGPRLLRAVAAAGRLDELCATVSPLLSAGPAGRILAGDPLEPTRPVRLAGLLEDDGSLFARWLVEPPPPG